MLQLPCGTRLS
jgi:(4S)-4-hydroxy-5-phosphonooxypentane-2,3-dione isomerase